MMRHPPAKAKGSFSGLTRIPPAGRHRAVRERNRFIQESRPAPRLFVSARGFWFNILFFATRNL